MSFSSRIASESTYNKNLATYDHLELLRMAVTEITNLDLETLSQKNNLENDKMLKEVLEFKYKRSSSITTTVRTRMLRSYTDEAVSRQVKLAGLTRANLKSSLKARGLYVEPEEALLSCHTFDLEKAINTISTSPTLETTLAPSLFSLDSNSIATTTPRPIKRNSSFPKSIPDSPSISPTQLFKSNSSSYIDETSQCESFYSLAKFENEYFKRPRRQEPNSHSHSQSQSQSQSSSFSNIRSRPNSYPNLYPHSNSSSPRPNPQTPRRTKSSTSLSYQQSSVFPSSNSSSTSSSPSPSPSTPQYTRSNHIYNPRRTSEGGGNKVKYYQCQFQNCGQLLKSYNELLNHREKSHSVQLQSTNRPSTSSPLKSSHVPFPIHRHTFSTSTPNPKLNPNSYNCNTTPIPSPKQTSKYFKN